MKTYDFPAKDTFRNRRDQAIDAFSPKPIALRRVAYLDTSEALDTMHRLHRGYRPENLFAVNDNPALAACLTQKLDRLGLPRVVAVGVDFERALRERLPAADVIDFDSTSNLHEKLPPMVSRCCATATGTFVLALTIVGGREGKSDFFGHHLSCSKKTRDSDGLIAPCDKEGHVQTSFGTVTNPSHLERITALLAGSCHGWVRDRHAGRPCSCGLTHKGGWRGTSECIAHVMDAKWDVYQSTSGQPMVWVVAAMRRHSDEARGRLLEAMRVGRLPRGQTRRGYLLGREPVCIRQRFQTLQEPFFARASAT